MCGQSCHWSARQRWYFTVATIGPCASKLAATWLLPYLGQGLQSWTAATIGFGLVIKASRYSIFAVLLIALSDRTHLR
jgi:hypothetical protein